MTRPYRRRSQDTPEALPPPMVDLNLNTLRGQAMARMISDVKQGLEELADLDAVERVMTRLRGAQPVIREAREIPERNGKRGPRALLGPANPRPQITRNAGVVVGIKERALAVLAEKAVPVRYKELRKAIRMKASPYSFFRALAQLRDEGRIITDDSRGPHWRLYSLPGGSSARPAAAAPAQTPAPPPAADKKAPEVLTKRQRLMHEVLSRMVAAAGHEMFTKDITAQLEKEDWDFGAANTPHCVTVGDVMATLARRGQLKAKGNGLYQLKRPNLKVTSSGN